MEKKKTFYRHDTGMSSAAERLQIWQMLHYRMRRQDCVVSLSLCIEYTGRDERSSTVYPNDFDNNNNNWIEEEKALALTVDDDDSRPNTSRRAMDR